MTMTTTKTTMTKKNTRNVNTKRRQQKVEDFISTLWEIERYLVFLEKYFHSYIADIQQKL